MEDGSGSNGTAGACSRGNPWVILMVVSLGFFMTLLDLTIVNIAIPNMISKLHASLDDILWVINAYALVLAVLLITAGRLGDLLGSAHGVLCRDCAVHRGLRRMRARAVAGLAHRLPRCARARRGIAYAPDARNLDDGLPGRAAGRGLRGVGAVAGVATIAGPTLGGLLVTAFDWRYIFFINLPIGVIVLVLTPFLIPDLRTNRKHSFDIGGVLLASLALLSICYALVEGQKYNWGTITSFISIPLLFVVGVVLLVVFLWLQARRQDGEPLVPFVLFKDRNYSLMNLVAGFIAIGMLGIFLPFSIYLQSVLGFSALKAGLTMAPASLLAMFVAPVAGRMSDRIGGKYILMAGLLLFAGGMGSIALIAQANSAWYDFLLPQVVVPGIGIGCTFAPMTTVALRNVNPMMAGAASGVFNTTRQVGTVIGTAGVGALLQNRLDRLGFTSQAQAARCRSAAAGQGSEARGWLPVGRQGRRWRSGRARTTRLVYEIFTHGFVDRHAADDPGADPVPPRRRGELRVHQAAAATASSEAAQRGSVSRPPLPPMGSPLRHRAHRPAAAGSLSVNGCRPAAVSRPRPVQFGVPVCAERRLTTASGTGTCRRKQGSRSESQTGVRVEAGDRTAGPPVTDRGLDHVQDEDTLVEALPAISATPSTHTLPGVADIERPAYCPAEARDAGIRVAVDPQRRGRSAAAEVALRPSVALDEHVVRVKAEPQLSAPHLRPAGRIIVNGSDQRGLHVRMTATPVDRIRLMARDTGVGSSSRGCEKCAMKASDLPAATTCSNRRRASSASGSVRNRWGQ